MTRVFVGVDPGVSGGIAAVSEDGRPLTYKKRPDSIAGVLEVFAGISRLGDDVACVLEFVRSSPQMGVKSVFTFGRGYGELRACLVATGIRFEEVPPHVWQKALNCRTGGDKNVTKAKAAKLFPSIVRVTHNIADSLLIAEFARRTALGLVVVDETPTVAPKRRRAMRFGRATKTAKTGDF